MNVKQAAWVEGFIEECERQGVDPEGLVKQAHPLGAALLWLAKTAGLAALFVGAERLIGPKHEPDTHIHIPSALTGTVIGAPVGGLVGAFAPTLRDYVMGKPKDKDGKDKKEPYTLGQRTMLGMMAGATLGGGIGGLHDISKA